MQKGTIQVQNAIDIYQLIWLPLLVPVMVFALIDNLYAAIPAAIFAGGILIYIVGISWNNCTFGETVLIHKNWFSTQKIPYENIKLAELKNARAGFVLVLWLENRRKKTISSDDNDDLVKAFELLRNNGVKVMDNRL